ncbi:MAG: MBL fold metallo-hydrolase [Clostridiales bacterium]|nr:MBL fold metallo-hydrolase [Clostridiales bacterium]
MTKSQKTKHLIVICICLLISAIICAFHFVINPSLTKILNNKFNIYSSHDKLLIHFVSVGQGDAIVVNLPDGKVLMIDTGLENTNIKLTNYVKSRVTNTLRKHKIDYLVLTHGDNDHVGGTMKILKSFDVGCVYLPDLTIGTDQAKELNNYILENDFKTKNIENGLEIVGKNYEIDFHVAKGFDEENDLSPLIKLSYKSFSALFTGDISSDVEKYFVDNLNNDLNADILKVAHHGSKYSSSIEFLEKVTPEYSVISCGTNIHGHPTSEVLNNLTSVGSKVLRTDKDGNIMFEVDDKIKFATGYYSTTHLIFNFNYCIVIIDLILLVDVVIILTKKDKRK